MATPHKQSSAMAGRNTARPILRVDASEAPTDGKFSTIRYATEPKLLQ